MNDVPVMKDNSQIKAAFIGGLFVLVAALIPYIFMCDFHKSVIKLKITDVKLNNVLPIQGLRISAFINGEDFSFPNRTLALVNPISHLPNQSFIVSKSSKYNCSFEIVVLDSTCVFHTLKPLKSIILNKNEINSGTFNINLFEIISDFSDKTEAVHCQIEFKIYKSNSNND